MNSRIAALSGALLITTGLATVIWFGRSSTPSSTLTDLRCLGGCPPPALSLLSTGALPGLIATGALSTGAGAPVVATRAGTRKCISVGGSVVTLPANTPCVETLGLVVDGGSEQMNAGPITLPGTPFCIGANFTPLGFNEANNGDLVNIFTTSNEQIYARLSTQDSNNLDCGFWNGSAGFDTISAATFSDGVRARFVCSYSVTAAGSKLRACIGNKCTSASEVFTRSVSKYTTVLLLNDVAATGLPFMPGHIDDLLVSTDPDGCF